MIFDLISSISSTFTYVFDWFVRFYQSLNAYDLIISLIIISLIYKFLLAPFFGSLGSDKAKKKTNNNEEK